MSDSSDDKQCNNLSMALRHADMMKEAYAQSIECEEPCEGRLSRTVLWEGEGETPSLYSTYDPEYSYLCCSNKESFAACPDFWMKKHREKFGYVAEIL